MKIREMIGLALCISNNSVPVPGIVQRTFSEEISSYEVLLFLPVTFQILLFIDGDD